MTAMLVIQGVEVPVADGSFSSGLDVVGDMVRAEDGTAIYDRRATKRKWSFSTVPLPAATAVAVRDLVVGKSQVWAFESSFLYSSKGQAIGGSPGTTAAQKKFGDKSMQLNASAVATVADQYDYAGTAGLVHSPWTAAFWWYNGSAWQHIVETSANQKYVNGAFVGTRTFCSGSTTTLSITNPDASTRYVDDLCLSRFLWPATWPAQVHGWPYALGPSPRLQVYGLGVDDAQPTPFLQAVGDVDSLDFVQGWYGGAFVPNLTTLKITLSEV